LNTFTHVDTVLFISMGFKSRWLRVFFLSLSLVIASSFAGITILILYANSLSGSVKTASLAKSFLENHYQIKLDYTEGAIDLLRGLHFKNLKVVVNAADLHAEAAITAIDLEYSFSILRRHFEIARLNVDHPILLVRAKETGRNEPIKQDKKSSDHQLKQLESFIKRPTVSFKADDVAITHLDLDFESEALDGSKANLIVKSADLSAALDFSPGRARASGSLATGEDLTLNSTTTSFRAGFSGHFDLALRNENNEWVYEIKPSAFAASLSELKFESLTPEKRSTVILPKATLNSKLMFLAKSVELFQTNTDSVRALEIKNEITLNGMSVQIRTKAKSQRVYIDSQTLEFNAALADTINFAFKAVLKRVNSAEFFVRPVDLTWATSGKMTRDLKSIESETRSDIANEEFLKINSQAAISTEKKATFSGQVDLRLSPKLADIAKAAAALKKTGGFQANLRFDGSAADNSHGKVNLKANVPQLMVSAVKSPLAINLTADASWDLEKAIYIVRDTLSLAAGDYGDWSANTKLEISDNEAAKGQTEITQSRPPASDKLPINFAKTITVDHKFNLAKGAGLVDVGILIPEIEVKNFARLNDTRLNFTIHSLDLTKAEDFDVTGELRQGGVSINPDIASTGVPITGVNVNLKGSLRGGSSFYLNQFLIKINDSVITASANAAGNIKSKDVQANLNLSISVPANFPKFSGVAFEGRLDLPARISVLHGDEIAIDGSVDLKDVSVHNSAGSVDGISGRMPFSEKLKFNGKSIRFKELITQNPFERVDFERVRPLLQGSEQIRIDRLQWQERQFGPLIGFFSIKQNVIFAHQFDLDVGGGRVYGELFFDAYPANMQIGTLSRLTNLDLMEILPAKYLAKVPTGEKKLSGRSGFVLNINKGTIDGRVDITEIGGSQLSTLLNVLDPGYEDEKLNKVRSLLQVGYPTSVGLALSEGYLDMDINLLLFGISKHESLYGIPVSSLVSQATSEVVKQTKKGPLK
jgi:hypothetical protein